MATETEVKAPTSAQEQILSQITVSNNLAKSLTTGYETGAEGREGGGALRREFLDSQVKQLSYETDQMVFFRKIAKTHSESTVAQYAVFNRHGKTGHQAFTTEGGIAKITDPELEQKMVRMKYLSETRQVTIVSTVVNNIENPQAIYTNDMIVTMAKNIEWASLYGDASLTDTPDPMAGIEFDGLFKLIDPENQIDARGEALSSEMLNNAAVHIAKGYGYPTDAFLPTGAKALFVNRELDNQRAVLQPSGGTSYSVGYDIPTFNSIYGPISLNASNVMENDLLLDESELAGKGAPQAPKVTGAATEGKGARFSDEDVANGLTYKVVVDSDDARSAASDDVNVAITAKDSSATLSINVAREYQSKPKFVTIYRLGPNDMYYQIDRVALSKAVNNVITYEDLNENIPGTVDVFIGQMTSDVIKLYELLPMMQLPLAQLNSTYTWSVLWFGALALIAPKKWVRLKNVGYVPVRATK